MRGSVARVAVVACVAVCAAVMLADTSGGGQVADAINKLEPHRTMHLRGFDRRGAAAYSSCAFSDKVVAHQEMADLMNTAGLTPWLPFGAFLWLWHSRPPSHPRIPPDLIPSTPV